MLKCTEEVLGTTGGAVNQSLFSGGRVAANNFMYLYTSLSVSYTFAPNFLPNLILRAHVFSEFLRYYVLS